MKKVIIFLFMFLHVNCLNSSAQCNLNIAIVQPITCLGPLVATVDFSASNATMPVTIYIDSLYVLNYLGFPISQPLFPGIYIVSLSDGSGCTDVDTLVIEGVVNGYATSYPASCLSCNNGAAIVNISNGVPPYFFSWSPNNQDTTRYADNLTPGNYACYITDSNGCVGVINSSIGYDDSENTLSGNLFFDENKNGIRDGTDYGLSNKKIQLSSQAISVFTWSDTSGNYVFFVDSGSYIISLNIDSGFVLSSDSASYSLNIVTPQQITNLDFGIKTDTITMIDGCVSLFGNLPRCNSNVNYNLKFKNKSNQGLDATIKLFKPSNVQYVSSSISPSIINSDTVIWNYTQLGINKEVNISSTLLLPNSPGSVIDYRVVLLLFDSLTNLVFSDTAFLSQLIKCSFDPNNKIASPLDSSSVSFITKDDYIYYTINFQNTGTDTAFNILIVDTLTGLFDLNTFEFLYGSHSAFLQLYSNVLRISFNNILLPDSNTNESASHGLINFRIRPIQNILTSSLIKNYAFIFFDANFPIVTDTTSTFIVVPTNLIEAELENSNVKIYPNPVSAKITIEASEKIFSIVIFDGTGKIVQVINSNSCYSFVYDTERLHSGLFLLKVICETDTYYCKVFKK